MFLGEYAHTIDDKGRVTIPARFRAELAAGLVVTRGFDQNRVTLRPCFQCPRLCPWDAEIGEGPYQGTIVHFNAGSEWMDTFYNLGFKGNDVLYLSERINDLGIECSHYACGAGLAFDGLVGHDQPLPFRMPGNALPTEGERDANLGEWAFETAKRRLNQQRIVVCASLAQEGD